MICTESPRPCCVLAASAMLVVCAATGAVTGSADPGIADDAETRVAVHAVGGTEGETVTDAGPVLTPLRTLSVTAHTGEKPQSKLWYHDGE